MITYKDFLDKVNIPSEEEFNEIISNIPPFEELSAEFEFDPQWDNLAEQLFNYGVLGDTFSHAYVDSFDYDDKSTYIQDLEDLEELNKVNEILTSAGWTLRNYEEDKKFFEEELAKEENDAKKEELLNELRNSASIEQLKEFVKNVNEK